VADDVKDLTELITKLRIDMARIESKLDNMKDINQKVDNIEQVLTQTAQSAKLAQERIDKIDRVIYWLATTIIGTIIAGLVTFIARGGFAS
jgi:predicted component of type VI protein secretion system